VTRSDYSLPSFTVSSREIMVLMAHDRFKIESVSQMSVKCVVIDVDSTWGKAFALCSPTVEHVTG
jgi:hypothetical protein